jgi:ribosomal protein L13, bacterial type
MTTFMAKSETVERKWYTLDAAGKPLGRTAAAAADILRGKHRPEFTPHVDCGEFVIIINADKAVLTGKKLEQKYYRRHSGYIGGLKSIQYRELMEKRPDFAMTLAVRGMLPKNTIGRSSLTRLKVFKGAEHNHQAQKPTALEI